MHIGFSTMSTDEDLDPRALAVALEERYFESMWTGEHSQLVIMTIPPDGEIGEEVHEGLDQILTYVSGTGEAQVGGQKRKVQQGDLVVVPSGKKHNFINTGPNPLVLYTVYAPPEHADGAVHKTKDEADAAEEAGEDQPPAS